MMILFWTNDCSMITMTTTLSDNLSFRKKKICLEDRILSLLSAPFLLFLYTIPSICNIKETTSIPASAFLLFLPTTFLSVV